MKSSIGAVGTLGIILVLGFSIFMYGNLVRRTFAGKMTDALSAVDFEVFGIVQGVFFRKHTEDEANKLGLRGWCMNTPDGSVKGQIEGPKSNIETMKHWLQYTGSPMSKIDRAVFNNEREINSYTFDDFGIKRRRK